MKKMLLITLFIAGKIGLAQSFELVGSDTINYTDVNNLKQGFWVITNKVKKLPNCDETAKIEEGTYADSKKVGNWKKYYCNGKLNNELTYVSNRPSGYARFYHENGNLMEEGQWENNRWVGEHKFYYETGKLNYVWTHNNTGKREGVQKYYHPNGKIMIEGDWKDGKENGVIKEYFEDGSLKAEKNYADGAFDAAKSKSYEPNQKEGSKEEAPAEVKKAETTTNVAKTPLTVGQIPDGFNKTFTRFGKPEKEGTFKDGKLLEGKVYIYEGTTHVKTALYKGGIKTGEEEVKK